jgi:citrate synthase
MTTMKAPSDSGTRDDPGRDLAADYWRTEIIDIEPGEIRVRGYPIE